jgi:hypothetical protein
MLKKILVLTMWLVLAVGAGILDAEPIPAPAGGASAVSCTGSGPVAGRLP